MLKIRFVWISLVIIIVGLTSVSPAFAEMIAIGSQNSSRMYIVDRSTLVTLFEWNDRTMRMFLNFPLGLKTLKTFEIQCQSSTNWETQSRAITFIAQYIDANPFIEPVKMLTQAGFSGCTKVAE